MGQISTTTCVYNNVLLLINILGGGGGGELECLGEKLPCLPPPPQNSRHACILSSVNVGVEPCVEFKLQCTCVHLWVVAIIHWLTSSLFHNNIIVISTNVLVLIINNDSL